MGSKWPSMVPHRALATTSWLIVFSICLQSQPVEARQWKSAKGNSKIEADFVSATATTVTIRRDDNGKTVTVPLAKLCSADQKYVAQQTSKDSEAEQTTLAVKRAVTRFYLILRKSERKELKELLTAAARTTFDSNSSFFDGISAPDRNSSPRIRSVDLDKDKATANMSVKIAGKFREVKVMLKRAAEEWQIEALAYKDDEDQFKRMDFATGQTSDGLEAASNSEATLAEGGPPAGTAESGASMEAVPQDAAPAPDGAAGTADPGALGTPPTARPPASMAAGEGAEGP